MDKVYVSHEVHDVSKEAANTARDIIDEIIGEVVIGDYEEETEITSSSEIVLNLNSAIKLGKDRLPQQNESGYLSELEASVCVS